MHEHLYERVFEHGAGSLSDEQLLRVLLRSGSQTVPLANTVAGLLAAYPHLARLDHADGARLTAISGIGLSKAVGIIASLELGLRVSAQEGLRYGEVKTIDEIGSRLVKQLRGIKQERFIAIFLDARLAVIEQATMALGGMSAAEADPRVVFTKALRVNASYLVLAHNHPSGDPEPSVADISVTARFIEAGVVVGVSVLDHLVIGQSTYHSFAQNDEGLNFFK
ncbi:RadC family protein [Lacticaseibacillus sp. GG6-2]